MKIPVLNDLHGELNRLFIAGAKFATGDLRVAKCLPALEKMGEKSPVMQKLAAMVKELTTTAEPETALAELGTMLNAILSTQGATAPEDVTEQPATAPAFFTALPQTTAPYSTLEPVVKALTATGAGRLDTLRAAHESGQLHDFRLYGLLSNGLGDKHAEFAEYIAATVVPDLGAVMLPFLVRDLDITDGGKANVARMMLLDKLNYAQALPLAERAVAEGPAAIQTAALRILGQDPKHEPLLLTYADDRKTEVKAAALIGLVKMDSAAGKEKMFKTLTSGKYKPALEAASYCTDPVYNANIFAYVKETAATKPTQEFVEKAEALHRKNDTETFQFFLDILGGKADRIAADYFLSIQWTHNPAEFFDIFHPFYRQDLMGYELNTLLSRVGIDPRWADEFIKKADHHRIEILLHAGIETPRLLKYLYLFIKKCETRARSGYDWGNTLRMAIKYSPDGTELGQIAYDAVMDIQAESWRIARLADTLRRDDSLKEKLFGHAPHLLDAINQRYENLHL